MSTYPTHSTSQYNQSPACQHYAYKDLSTYNLASLARQETVLFTHSPHTLGTAQPGEITGLLVEIRSCREERWAVHPHSRDAHCPTTRRSRGAGAANNGQVPPPAAGGARRPPPTPLVPRKARTYLRRARLTARTTGRTRSRRGSGASSLPAPSPPRPRDAGWQGTQGRAESSRAEREVPRGAATWAPAENVRESASSASRRGGRAAPGARDAQPTAAGRVLVCVRVSACLSVCPCPCV